MGKAGSPVIAQSIKLNASQSQSDAEDLEVSWSATGFQSTGRLKQLELMSIRNAAGAVTGQMNLPDRVKASKQRENLPPSTSLFSGLPLQGATHI